MKTLAFFITLVVAGLVVAGCATSRTSQQTYEYRVEKTGNQIEEMRAKIGEWAAQGWAVQSVTSDQGWFYYFLRRAR